MIVSAEPSGRARRWAAAFRDLYTALAEQGFTEHQCLALTRYCTDRLVDAVANETMVASPPEEGQEA